MDYTFNYSTLWYEVFTYVKLANAATSLAGLLHVL